MDGLISSEAFSEEGLITKRKNKPLLQKLRSRWFRMVHPWRRSKQPTRYQGLQGARGVGTRGRISEWFRGKHCSHSDSQSEGSLEHPHRKSSSDRLFYFPDQNRFNTGKKNAQLISSDKIQSQSDRQKNPQHSHSLFHLSHPKVRLHFHPPCRLNLHLHPPHLDFHKNYPKQKGDSPLPKDVPKGFLAVYVGSEHQRFVIPVFYLNHPLFGDLLKGMEQEFGFQQNGALLIPCEVSNFELLRSRIERKSSCKTRSSSCRTNQDHDEEQHAD